MWEAQWQHRENSDTRGTGPELELGGSHMTLLRHLDCIYGAYLLFFSFWIWNWSDIIKCAVPEKQSFPPSFCPQLGALRLGGGMGGGSQLTHMNEFKRQRRKERERDREGKREKYRKKEQVQGGGWQEEVTHGTISSREWTRTVYRGENIKTVGVTLELVILLCSFSLLNTTERE